MKTFTEGLRDRLLAVCAKCPTCGTHSGYSLRTIAKGMGVAPSTLSRWLNQGRQPDANTIDRAVVYLTELGA